MPWNAVGYFTMWLQTLGFSDMPAGALTALFWGGTALGNLLGGIVGDALAKRLPNVGRQLTCQVSITALYVSLRCLSTAAQQHLALQRPLCRECICPMLSCMRTVHAIRIPHGQLFILPAPLNGSWTHACHVPVQMSIAFGLPLVAILIKALPDRGGAEGSMDPLTGGYGVLLFVLGSVISWPQTQNSAMFSEVRRHLHLI